MESKDNFLMKFVKNNWKWLITSLAVVTMGIMSQYYFIKNEVTQIVKKETVQKMIDSSITIYYQEKILEMDVRINENTKSYTEIKGFMTNQEFNLRRLFERFGVPYNETFGKK